MMHFTDARDALMMKYHWSRKVATLALRITKRIDDYEILRACVGFHGNPLLTFRELFMIYKTFRE